MGATTLFPWAWFAWAGVLDKPTKNRIEINDNLIEFAVFFAIAASSPFNNGATLAQIFWIEAEPFLVNKEFPDYFVRQLMVCFRTARFDLFEPDKDRDWPQYFKKVMIWAIKTNQHSVLDKPKYLVLETEL